MREKYSKVAEIPFNSTNKYQVLDLDSCLYLCSTQNEFHTSPREIIALYLYNNLMLAFLAVSAQEPQQWLGVETPAGDERSSRENPGPLCYHTDAGEGATFG